MAFRIPHHMFLRWFVPYTPRGSFLMASLSVPTLAALGMALFPSETLAWLCIALSLQLALGTVFLSYHRRVSVQRWLTCHIVGLGLILSTAFLFWPE